MLVDIVGIEGGHMAFCPCPRRRRKTLEAFVSFVKINTWAFGKLELVQKVLEIKSFEKKNLIIPQF